MGITTRRSGILHYCGHGRPSQLLLSSCFNVEPRLYTTSVTEASHFLMKQRQLPRRGC